jgi:hypothetical protein
MAHDQHYVSQGTPVTDHRHPDRPLRDEVVAGVAETPLHHLGDLGRIVEVASVDDSQLDLAGGRHHLLGAVRVEPQPGAHRLAPAHPEPKAIGDLLDGGRRRQQYRRTDRDPGVLPVHRFEQTELPPGQLLDARSLPFEPDGHPFHAIRQLFEIHAAQAKAEPLYGIWTPGRDGL